MKILILTLSLFTLNHARAGEFSFWISGSTKVVQAFSYLGYEKGYFQTYYPANYPAPAGQTCVDLILENKSVRSDALSGYPVSDLKITIFTNRENLADKTEVITFQRHDASAVIDCTINVNTALRLINLQN